MDKFVVAWHRQEQRTNPGTYTTDDLVKEIKYNKENPYHMKKKGPDEVRKKFKKVMAEKNPYNHKKS
ncbi:MAG: hypothetical protein VW397_03205 [Candidatus Margulisiibacteriota bacterium]